MPDDYPERPDRIRDAIARLRVGLDAVKNQKKREVDALRFQTAEGQWPAAARQQREAQVVNGIHLPERPCLSIPTLDQPIQLNENQFRRAHFGIQIEALSEDASDDTAETLEGLYRTIERDSRANLARLWAYQRALRAGRGAYRVNTVYDPSSPVPGDQKIVIQRILYQESAVFDPFATEPDWSDGLWAFEPVWLPWSTYTKRYSKSKLSGYSEQEILEEATITPEWIRGDKESRAVLVCRYWRVEIIPGTNQADEQRVFVSTINAVEELEKEREWNGRYIPLIPVVGRELIPFDQERRWQGMIEPNMDAARLVNYSASNAVEMAALEPKAQFDVDPEEIQGYEAWWQLANVRNFPYLPRHKFAPNGQPFGPIQRIQADMSRLGPSLTLLQQGREFIHIGTGAYEPTLGETSGRQKSGRAILSLQQQHEEGNSHWLDNLAEISLAYEAKVVLDLIPRVYDRPGRVERILDLEGKKTAVMLNCPFVAQKGRPQRVDEGQPLPQGCQPDAVKHYELAKGRFGVSVDIGKGYKSRLDEGNDRLGSLFEAKPELFQFLGDIWLGFQSWPGHKEAQERMKRLLPKELQDEDGQQDPKLQLQQATAMIQQLQQQLQQAAQAIQTDQVKAQAQVEVANINADKDLALQVMRNAAEIAKAHIAANAKGADIAAHAREEGIALASDHIQSEQDRQHEVLMQAREHAQAERDRQHEREITAMQPEPNGSSGE